MTKYARTIQNIKSHSGEHLNRDLKAHLAGNNIISMSQELKDIIRNNLENRRNSLKLTRRLLHTQGDCYAEAP